MPAPTTLTFGDLTTCHPDYEELVPVWSSIEDFYVGGFRLAKVAGRYVKKLVGENPKRYAERVGAGSYFNYFGQICDYFAAALFTQELAVRPPGDHDKKATPGETPPDDVYEQFSKNADGSGRTLNQVLSGRILACLKFRTAWLQVDFPAADVRPASKAEEDALGLALPYVFEIPHESVIDWDRDEDDELTYVVVRKVVPVRGRPGNRRKDVRETFEIWTRTPVETSVGEDDGSETEYVVEWARYELVHEADKKPKDKDEVPLVGEGTSSFPRIPILEMAIDPGLWVGNKIAPMAREHFSRRTSLNAAENRSMVAIPVVKLGPEVPDVHSGISEAQENPNRGQDPVSTFVAKGYEVIGKDDSIEFVEPSGHAYEHVAKRIDDLKQEMFRISHQLAASASMQAGSGLQRSGKSKAEDRAAEALVLGALGRVVRNFAVRLFDTISRARGEDVVWVAHGLDTYEHEDREQTLEESIQIAAVGIPSPTFRKEHCKRVYRKLVPNLPPQTAATIDSEIEDGVDSEEERRQLELDAAKERAKNPPVPTKPGGEESPPTDKAPEEKPEKGPEKP